MPRSVSSKAVQVKTAISNYSGGTLSLPGSHSLKASADFLEPILEELSTLNVAEVNILKGVPNSTPNVNSTLPIFEDASTIKCFAARLKNAREGIFPRGKKLTLEEVGNALGISGAAIHKKEKNLEKKIDRADLLSFSLLFQISPHYLLGLVTDPYGYLLTNGVTEALILALPKFDPTRYGQQEHTQTITAPMQFVSDTVCTRGQLILYHTLLDSPDLLQIFSVLAKKPLDDQQRTLARFSDLSFLHEEYIDDKLLWAASEDFKEKWCDFIIQPAVQKRHQVVSDALATFADLGKRNFDCLDSLARITCVTSSAHKEMIFLLLKESLQIRKNNLVNLHKSK